MDTSEISRNGKSKSVVLSSNTTIVWRVFMPVFVTVFFAGFVVIFWFGINADELSSTRPLIWSRWTSLGVLLFWLFWTYRFLWPLKRVEANDAYVFVSNYWQTVRYAWSDVEKLEEKKRAGLSYIRMHLKAPGRFGKVIRFIPGSSYKSWVQEYGKE